MQLELHIVAMSASPVIEDETGVDPVDLAVDVEMNL
jgi:hypothetical protein